MTLTLDNSHPEVTRLSLTPASGSREDVSATVTTLEGNRHNSSVMTFTLTGETLPDLTCAPFAQGGTARYTIENGQPVCSVTFTPEHTAPALSALGLPPTLPASIGITTTADTSAITITALEPGRELTFTPEPTALLKALTPLLPDALKSEMHKAHPEMLVQAAVQAITIAGEAVALPDAPSLTITHRAGGLHIALPSGTEAREALLHHLNAHHLNATQQPDGIGLPKGISGAQALTALAKPAPAIIENGVTTHAAQPPILSPEVAAHAAPLVEETRPQHALVAGMEQALAAAARLIRPNHEIRLAEATRIDGPLGPKNPSGNVLS
ncbi:MAG: hypothetical protein V4735_04945 [Pseudomonadota bacterium]